MEKPMVKLFVENHVDGCAYCNICNFTIDAKDKCNCVWRAHVKTLQKIIEVQEKAVSFYAGLKNYCVWKTMKGITQYITRLPMSDCTTHNDCGYELVLGGKLARETEVQVKKLKAEL